MERTAGGSIQGTGSEKAVEGATTAVLEFLEDTSVGQWLLAGVVRAPRVEGVGEDEVPEGEEGGPGPP